MVAFHEGHRLLPLFSFLDLCRAAIYEQFGAVHEARLIRSQEQRGRRDFPRTADFTSRNERRKRSLCIGSERVESRRVDRSGAQNIYANLSFLQVDEPCSRKGPNGSFTRAIHAEIREAFDCPQWIRSR